MRFLLLLLVSCVSASDTAVPRVDGSFGDDTGSPTETGGTVNGEPAELAAVGHEREFRAVWVATVSNIDFPSSQSSGAEAQQAELIEILDTMAAAGLNAIVFQVRPEGDALYASDLEPWSRYLTGSQGQDPGYDPLEFLTTEAHARNIEVHAWLNPYRAKATSSSAAVAPHMAVMWPEHAHQYGNYLWMDPGAAPVQDRLVDVIVDIVERYDVDGIHFDDYFYPYPDGTEFPDDATYADYQAAGGALGRDDWRRDNVNRMVQRVSEAIKEVDPAVRFGISPFGIYRPGEPSGITGLDQYEEIYSDPKHWTEQGWLDYLAPQLYWPSTQTAQAYGALIAWWATLPTNGQYTFAGNYLSQLDSSESWSVDEFRQQLALSRAYRDEGSQGNIFFSYSPLGENRSKILDVFAQEFYPAPALTPPLRAAAGEVAPPSVTVSGGDVALSHPDLLRAWVVYRDEGGEFVLDRVVPSETAAFALESGRWAISAADRRGLESEGVVVEIP